MAKAPTITPPNEGGMMSNLSISTAWEESRALLAHDGRLFASVALALIGIPTTVSALIEPKGMALAGGSPWWVAVLTFVFALLALVGQLALVRLALKPSITVGAAINHGARRMPIYLVTALLIGLCLAVLIIPLAIGAKVSGIPLDKSTTTLTPALTAMVLVIVLVAIFIAVRMLMATPVASAEPAGPLEIVKRSWSLTQGKWWKLFGFMVMIVVAATVVLVAISAIVGSVVTVALGAPVAMSVSALVIGLFEGLFNAAFTAVFAVMLARIYVQLSGRETVDAPVSGT